MTHLRSLARNRDFTVLWTGEAISQLGSSLSMFAFPLVGYALTGSAAEAALAESALLLGLVTMLLPAGVLADRFDRKRLMLASRLVGVATYAGLVLAMLTGTLTLGRLVLGALLSGAVAGLFEPVEMSAVRAVVPAGDLPAALSQNQARRHVASLLGGPVGGALYTVGRVLPFVADLVSYVVSLCCLTRLRTDLSAPADRVRGSVRTDLREGFRFVLGRPFFRANLASSALGNLAINAIFTMAILRMITAGVAPAWIGLVETCMGIGGILGAFLAPALVDRVPTGRLTVLIAWGWLPLVAPLAFTASPWVVGACIAVGMLLNPAGNAAMGSYRMSITPDALQGRVASAMQCGGMLTMPLAPVLGGVLLHRFGATGATSGLIAAVALAALVPTLSRSMRSVPRPAEWQREATAAEQPVVAA